MATYNKILNILTYTSVTGLIIIDLIAIFYDGRHLPGPFKTLLNNAVSINTPLLLSVGMSRILYHTVCLNEENAVVQNQPQRGMHRRG
jgi:hypothetical protein